MGLLVPFTKVEAQNDLFRVKGGFGLATYYGDLKDKAKVIDQSSLAFNLGLTYDSLNNKTKALEYFNQALKIARDSQNKRLEATLILNIGSVTSPPGISS